MSARRRRAALSTVAAVLAALICAALAGNVGSGSRRAVLLVLALAWLVVAGSSVTSLLRTETPLSLGKPGDDAGGHPV